MMTTELFYSHILNMSISSVVYATLFLDTDELKIALRDQTVPGAFEKRAPGPKKLSQSLSYYVFPVSVT